VTEGAGSAPSVAAVPEVRRYLVEPGDSLLAIAYAFDVELDALLAANDLHIDDPIIAGQELLLPPSNG
jgi:LysM repeat protein